MKYSPEDIENARKALTTYLESKQQRMVPKRFAILEQIYQSEKGHFTADELYDYLLEQNFSVSRATVYNTINLLFEAELLAKLKFLEGASVYEKALNVKRHHHYICTECGRIQDLRDDGVIKTAVMTRRITKFKQKDFSLCIYGICAACKKIEVQ